MSSTCNQKPKDVISLQMVKYDDKYRKGNQCENTLVGVYNILKIKIGLL